jgi:hypothetical protein
MSLKSRIFGREPTARPTRAFKPALEELESRVVPAAPTLTTLSDVGQQVASWPQIYFQYGVASAQQQLGSATSPLGLLGAVLSLGYQVSFYEAFGQRAISSNGFGFEAPYLAYVSYGGLGGGGLLSKNPLANVAVGLPGISPYAVELTVLPYVNGLIYGSLAFFFSGGGGGSNVSALPNLGGGGLSAGGLGGGFGGY